MCIRDSAGPAQLRPRSDADGPEILAGRGGDDSYRHPHRVARHEQRTLGMVRRRAGVDGVFDFCHNALSVASQGGMTGRIGLEETKLSSQTLIRYVRHLRR